MDSRLAELQKKARQNSSLRQELLQTRNASNPLQALCDCAQKYGLYITAEELATLGEESCAAMLRSQNGGGEYEPFGCWNDDYELFFLLLEGES